MNSKKLGILVVLLALLTALFVSCNSDVADNSAVAAGSKELVYATFDNSSKGITVDTVVGYKTYDELYWFYTATKKDSYGTTGQTSVLVPVSKNAQSQHTPGLSGKVGPFSQGKWSFTLYAYDTAEKATLYYQGTTSSDVTLINGVDNYIPVTVTPQGDEGAIAFYNGTNTTDTYFIWNENLGGEGALRLDISMKDADGVAIACVSKNLTKGADNRYKIEGNILRKTGETTSTEKFSAGVYTVKFEVVDSESGNLVFASQNLSLRVYGNLTTQLKGDLTEIVNAYGYFEVPEQQINVFIATAEAVTQTVNVAPEKYSSSLAQQTTTVKFEAAALDTTNSQHTLKVEVTPIATAATKFDVIGDETAVAGIDFELKKIVTTTVGDVTTTTEQTVETFENQKYATIETYIAKGFKTVTVVYTGTALAQPIANELESPTNVATVYDSDSDMGNHLGYSKATGLLRFKTNHFSEYYVKASVEAINVTTNTVYTTLADAVNAVKNNETIQLIKNVTLATALDITAGEKSFTLDLNEKTLSGRVNLKSGSLTIKNGTVAGGSEQALNVYGSSTVAENYSVLTVASDVTVTANVWAVCLFGPTYLSEVGYGAVVNFYGTANTTGDNGKEGAIFVSGNLGKNCGLADQKNIINIYGSVTSSTDAALALNGNALVNIFEGASLTGNTALTVKRGKLVVAGGTITSNGAENYPPTANNNGTEMTGAGVSVTATYNQYGPLAVEISGGTFVSANADAVFKADQTYQNNATISITGGVFSSNPSEVHVTDSKVDNYVAPGYYADAEKIAGKWVVMPNPETNSEVSVTNGTTTVYMTLSEFRDSVNSGNSYEGYTVTLLKDVDLGGNEWTPIGTKNHPFEGVFDGQNHTIKNLTSVNGHTGEDAVEGQSLNGLFGFVRGTSGNTSYDSLDDVWNDSTWNENSISIDKYSTQIKNIVLESINLSSTFQTLDDKKTFFGGIVGAALNTYIYNCKVDSGAISGDNYVGGIVGYMDDSIVKACSTGSDLAINLAIHDGRSDGGIVGSVSNRKNTNALAKTTLMHCNAIIDCTNNANITSSIREKGPIGGILGMAQEAKCSPIVNCVNNGKITVTNVSDSAINARIGGIIGQTQSVGLLYNCVNNGVISYSSSKCHSINSSIEENVEIAGIACYGSLAVSIVDCSNHGDLNGPANYMAGVMSHASGSTTMTNCSNSGILNNTISPNSYGQTSDIAIIGNKMVIENTTFESVSCLYDAIKDVSGSVIIENVTVTDTTGTLVVPAGVRTLVANTQIATSVDISYLVEGWHEVSVPNVSIALNNDLSGASLSFAGACNTISVGENGNASYIHVKGSGSSFTNNGTIGSLTINSAIANSVDNPVVNNGTIRNNVTFAGDSDHKVYFTNNEGKTIGRADSTNHTVSTQAPVDVVIYNKGTIVGSAGHYALLFYGNSNIVFNAYSTSKLIRNENGYLYVISNGPSAHALSCTFNVESSADGASTNPNRYYSISNSSSSSFECVTTVNIVNSIDNPN